MPPWCGPRSTRGVRRRHRAHLGVRRLGRRQSVRGGVPDGAGPEGAPNPPADFAVPLRGVPPGLPQPVGAALRGGGYFLALNSEREELDYYFDHREDALFPYASPLYVQDLSGLPPAVFVSAECDPLLDQALMYAARLEDAGVEVEYHLYEGMVHAFLNRPQQKTFEALDVSAAACR